MAFRTPVEIKAHCGKLPFNGFLRVTDKIIGADADQNVMVTLEDITAVTSYDAKRLIKMLEQGYSLGSDVWEY